MLSSFRRQTELAPAVPSPPPNQVNELRAQVASLANQLDLTRAMLRRAEKRAAAAEQHIDTQRIAAAATVTDQIGRMQRTLHALDDLLEGCRLAHGSNVRASALPAMPDPLAVCQWCHKPVVDPTADCDQPDCRDKDRWLSNLFAGRPPTSTGAPA